VLGRFLDGFLDDPAEVQLALLTAIVKLFIMRPTAGQELVPRVLKWATEDVDSPDIRDRGFIYWRLLSTDPEMARAVVLSEKPEISAEGEKLDMPLLEELILQVGTLSSIYRKPPAAFIPFAKRRVLGQSPALARLAIAAPPVSRLPRTASTTAASSTAANAGAATGQRSSRQLTSGSQQPAASDPSVPPSMRNSSTQLSTSMVDVAGAGMSNPYISDITPGPMPDANAMLIDLMSMEDDDEGAAIGSSGMAGFNASFGMSALNMSAIASGPAGTTVNAGGAGAGGAGGASGADAGAARPPDSQLLNSAFDAAGLDTLSKMQSSSLSRAPGSSSPMPDIMRQFTSSFDLPAAAMSASGSASSTAIAGAGAGAGVGAGSNPQTSVSPFQQPSSHQPTSPFSVPLSAGTTASAFPSSLSSVSPGFNALVSSSSFDASGQISSATSNLPLLNSVANSAEITPLSAPPLFGSFPQTAATQKEVDDLAAQMYSTNMMHNNNNNSNNNSNNAGLSAGAQGFAASGSGSTPYVPAQKLLLDAQQTQGLEILGTFARRGGQIQMEMSFANKSTTTPIGDFAIQFNKNTYGLVPRSPIGAGTVMPMSAIDVCLPLGTGGPAMPMQPPTNIQIAIKCTAGIFYFQTQYSLHILLDENAMSDQGSFLRAWKDAPDSLQNVHSIQNLRFASMDDVRNKLNMNNVFTVAQRTVGNATHFYTTSRLAVDSSMFYSEIKVANNLQIAVVTTKSANTQLVPLYQKAIEDICTAF
ncbi:hypothetical protein H4S06_004170, partial [Coemansia sp. BCRC 34490]